MPSSQDDFFEFRPRGVLAHRGDRLEQLLELRQAGAPRFMVRHNQLSLWAYRQALKNPAYFCKDVTIPGLQENFVKFVMIHYTAGRT